MDSLPAEIPGKPVNQLSVQFTQSCPTLCDPMDCSLPGFPVHHPLLELTQTSDFGIDHLVMSMCRGFCCVVGRGCLLWPVCSLGKTLLAFALLHPVLQSQISVTPGISCLPTFAFQSPIMKRTSFWGEAILSSMISPLDCNQYFPSFWVL